MRITKIIWGLGLASCLVFSFAQAASPSATAADLEKLQDQVRVIDKDLSVLKETAASRLDAQDKRIGDIGLNTAQHANHLAAIANQTTNVGNLISNTSVLITLLVFVAGLITYFNATSRAEKEAQEASREWFEQHAARLTGEIEKLQTQTREALKQVDDLRQQANTASSVISAHTDQVTSGVKDFEQIKAKAASQILESTSAKDGSPPTKQDKEAIEIFRKASDTLKIKPESDFTADDHYTRGVKYFADGNYQSALSAFQQATTQLDDSAPSEKITRFLFAEGVTLGALGKSEEAITVYEDIDRRFGTDPTPGVREQVVNGLFNKGVRLGSLGKSEAAIAMYDDIDRRFGADSTPGVREPVAKGLFNKGVTLGTLGKSQEAIAVYDDIDRRFGTDSTPGVREQVANGLFNKGVSLGTLGKSEAAIAVYDDIDRRFGTDSTPGVREPVVKGLFNKGVTLGTLGKSQEAIAVYDDIDRRFGADSTPGVREQVANGLYNKGASLGTLGKSEEAIAVYDEIDRRFGTDLTPGVREPVAKGLFNKGVRLGTLGKSEDATAVYDDIDRRFGADSTPGVREQVASALFNKGVSLGTLGKSEEAIAVYDNIDRQFGTDPTPGVREPVVKGIFNKGLVLATLDKSEEALAVYDDIDRRFGADPTPSVREPVVSGLVNKGVRLGTLGKSAEAMAVYEDIDRRFGQDDAPGVRAQLAKAQNMLGFMKLVLAKTCWQDITQRLALLSAAQQGFERAQSNGIQDNRAMVLGNLGYSLFLAGEREAARVPTLECLKLGGQKQLDLQVAAANQHRLEPEDSAYETWLDELWHSLPQDGRTVPSGNTGAIS